VAQPAPQAARPAVQRPSPLVVGTVVWLSSELLFFSGLLAAWFTLRAEATGPWPPEGAEVDAPYAFVLTVLLVASSVTMHQAVAALRDDDRVRFRRRLALTAGLGAAFLAGQVVEWARLPFTPGDSAFGSTFVTLTGFHGAHVLGGVVAMAVLLGRAADVRFGADDLPRVEVVSWYWHFVDSVWLVLFAVLYLLA